MGWMLGILVTIGCGGGRPIDGPPEIEKEILVPEVETSREEASSRRYVVASRLNLRETPGGRRRGSLTINTPVRILEQQDELDRVRVGNGKTGWVPDEFLSREPLTVDVAIERAAAAERADERLAWAQRAAALDERDRRTLEVLASAYREMGREDLAERVERTFAWPSSIRLVGSHPRQGEHLVVEWEDHWEDPEWMPEPSERYGIVEMALGPEQMRALGVAVGQKVWVLPSLSAAVEGRVIGMRHGEFNHCGETHGFTMEVDAALPEGEAVIAYAIAPPPASWGTPAPDVDLAPAIERVKDEMASGYPPPTAVHAVPAEDGVFVRVALGGGEGQDPPTWTLVDYRMSSSGELEKVGTREDVQSYIGYDVPIAARDVRGDGRLETIFEGECRMVLEDADGDRPLQTAGLCCGC